LCACSRVLSSYSLLISNPFVAIFVFRYFQAANPSSIDRNIFSIPLPLDSNLKFTDASPTPAPTPLALTDTSTLARYSASFSPKAGFYLLSYDGPNVPWQRVIKTNDTSACRPEREDSILTKRDLLGFDFVVNDNTPLNVTWNDFETPIIKYTTIESDGYGEEKLFCFLIDWLVPHRHPSTNRVKLFVEQS
jgi:dipeptidyl aminopeptidase